MRDPDDLLAIADGVVARCRADEDIEVVVVHDRSTDVSVYGEQIETLSAAESQGVGIRVVRDHRQGFAYASSLDDAVVAATLEDARDNAGFGSHDDDAGLAEPDGVAYAALDLWSGELEHVSTDEKVRLAFELERQVVDADPRIRGVERAEYSDGMYVQAAANSHGVRASGSETTCALLVFSLAEDGDEVQTGFGWSLGRDVGDLVVERAAADAADRAVRLLGATKPASDRLTVVLDPWVTGQLVTIVSSMLSADEVQKGRSPFADRIGDTVASTLIELVDDPTDLSSYTATTFDGEGLATRRNAFIRDGVLEGFAHNSTTARRAGTASTGSAIRGFKSTPGAGCVAVAYGPGASPPEELIAAVDQGVLVQDVSGLHSGVNPVSGDFSTGASGFRITDGQLGEPLREFTIASTLQKMLLDVVAVGSDLTWMPMTGGGQTLVIDDVTVSGQ